jgi:hypothetical protein
MIGHSTRTWAEFLALLRTNKIGLLADVRRFPASRKHSQFNQDELCERLASNSRFRKSTELNVMHITICRCRAFIAGKNCTLNKLHRLSGSDANTPSNEQSLV